jgi:hypothetical protein
MAKSSGEILSDPTTSNWLHDALRTSLGRDPVKAVNDAEFLFNFLEERLQNKNFVEDHLEVIGIGTKQGFAEELKQKIVDEVT